MRNPLASEVFSAYPPSVTGERSPGRTALRKPRSLAYMIEKLFAARMMLEKSFVSNA